MNIPIFQMEHKPRKIWEQVAAGSADSRILVQAMDWLSGISWSVDQYSIVREDGVLWWGVSGENASHVVRADGATQEEAWVCVVEAVKNLI